MKVEQLIAYLTGSTLTVNELIKVYTDFRNTAFAEGLEHGASRQRHVYSRARACKRENYNKHFNEFITKVEDYLSAEDHRGTL